MMFEVLTLKDSDKWRKIVESFDSHIIDIYFYPEYLRSWQSCISGEVICFYAKCSSIEILYPAIKSKINGYSLNNDYFDISSVYGYGGAIINGDLVNDSIKKKFSNILSDWCNENNVIAEFIREYPEATFRCIDNTKRILVRTNVCVDTSREAERIWKNLPSKAKRNVMQARKAGVKLEKDENLDTIEKFYELYCITADDRKFQKFYHFPKSYFFDVKEYLDSKTMIINAVENCKIVASVLCFMAGEKFTYHLGASLPSKRNIRPNDLLYWGMIEEASAKRCKLLQLGGGMTTKNDDSLYCFKKKYGTHFVPIYIETCVHNEKIYKELCCQWSRRYPHLDHKKNYFLKYREQD